MSERKKAAPATMSGEQLRAWRERLGYNATKAAEALGCHRNAIAGWESGKHPIPKYIELACLYLATDWRR